MSRKRTCTLVGLVAPVLAVFLWAWPRPPVTVEQQNEIRVGMSVLDVHHVLGSPLEIRTFQGEGAGMPTRVYHVWKVDWNWGRPAPPLDKALFALDIRNETVYAMCYWPDDTKSFLEKTKAWLGW